MNEFSHRFDLANGKCLSILYDMIKSKQIFFEVTCAWDCFTTWKVICIMYLYWNVFQ